MAVLAILQNDAPEAVVVNYPAQLGTDEQGEIILRDYLEFISSEKGVIFINPTSLASAMQTLH
ncbi:UNVERIFIED_ORG: hypothetical protein [Escherichia phage CMSTMSU]